MVDLTAPLLSPPGGFNPHERRLTRRSLAVLLGLGYAAYATAPDADPIVTDAAGLTIETLTTPSLGADLPLYVARPQSRGRFPAIIVVSEVFGVHAYVKDICRRLAKIGYVAVAPSFFFRNDPEARLTTTNDFATITAIVSAARNEQVMTDVGSTIDWLSGKSFVDADRLGVVGFCWGGAVVWMSCARHPALKAGVAWYGRLSPPPPGSLGSDDPRPWPLEIVGQLKAPVLGLYGGKDAGIPASDVDRMRALLQGAGRTRDQLVIYPEAQHGFHADYRSSYNKEAAEDGWARMLAFLKAQRLAPGAKRGFFG